MATSTPSTTASSPDKSPPNANSEPPTSSNLTTPPPPPPLPASPPPTSPPPLALPSPPPPNLSPPPVSAPPPTPMASPPPPLSASPPPPAAVPPSPPTSSSPPITVPPPTPSKPSPSTQLPSNSSAATPPPRNMPAHYPSPPGNPSLPPPPTNPSSSMTPPARPLATPSNPSISSNSSLDTNRPLGGSHSSGGGNKTGAAVGITIAISFVMLTFLGLAVWFARKRKKQVGGHVGSFVMSSSLLGASQISEASLVKSNSASHGFPYSPSVPDLGYSKSRFTYEELSDATDGFLTQNLLGEGGFGCVYKGRMPDGREVAVKQLKVGGSQGEREFSAEVEIIGRIHHRHLVSLVGYCILDHQRLLVYDYVPNNTLYYHLHGEGELLMDWSTRVKVAAGAARGISYLHEDCHPRIIHRDIKSSNILLDKNFEAQVSDFGLAKLALDADTHITTRVMGTFGYLAPEYASSGKLTDKSDVYSFGVVLLELVTGRKPVDSFHPLGDEGLVEWARPLMAHTIETGDFEDLPDPRLKKDYNESEMFRMIDVAAACVRHSASMRPRMGQVVRALDGLADSLDLHNGIKPGQSELFNSAQESAEIRLFRRMAFGNQDFSTDFSWRSQRDW